MCLITTQAKREVAKKDLIVYKAVILSDTDLTAVSPMNEFLWDKGQLYKTRIKKSVVIRGFSIAQYLDDTAFRAYEKERTKVLYTISEGFHAATTARRLTNFCINDNFTIKRFIIPKGSTIYRDCTGLIVSNKMMMK